MNYTGTYKVMKIFRISSRRQVIKRGLTLEEAKQLVNSCPDSSRSMVVFTKQFTADKYFTA
jgi:ribosomal protein L7/L12